MNLLFPVSNRVIISILSEIIKITEKNTGFFGEIEMGDIEIYETYQSSDRSSVF